MTGEKRRATARRNATTALTSTVRAWRLAENTAMRLPHGRRASVVRVERGTVLVTQRGDVEDHVLEPGDELLLEGGGLAVAWAFTPASISMRAALDASEPARAARLGDAHGVGERG